MTSRGKRKPRYGFDEIVMPRRLPRTGTRRQADNASFRHMPFERKLVKQRVLLDLPFPHHRLPPSCRDARLYRLRQPVFQQYRAGGAVTAVAVEWLLSARSRDLR